MTNPDLSSRHSSSRSRYEWSLVKNDCETIDASMSRKNTLIFIGLKRTVIKIQ